MRKFLTNLAVSALNTGWLGIVVGTVVAMLIAIAIGAPASDILVAGPQSGGATGS